MRALERELLSKEELDRLLDPENMVRPRKLWIQGYPISHPIILPGWTDRVFTIHLRKLEHVQSGLPDILLQESAVAVVRESGSILAYSSEMVIFIRLRVKRI